MIAANRRGNGVDGCRRRLLVNSTHDDDVGNDSAVFTDDGKARGFDEVKIKMTQFKLMIPRSQKLI